MRAKKSVLSLAVTLAMTTGLALSTQAHAKQEQTEQQAAAARAEIEQAKR